ncbi:endonuclease/exonuclease/phosphatase family protein [Glaciihabitans arcticus]|uniref:Endonuclease/exonuclease/phosphatase family protein n=1 Tax=Glaciihabitans arcticus TaxID=2668039 RepID=A0A4Q9GX63_9MICO|nr:endonuclease/exonuclease/phosphatase family protein [Glaciihabitans arcticus]TBN57323.1 endonuclease/exonuclease/phosphatase family protein [Glaciihabitans arcticus]
MLRRILAAALLVVLAAGLLVAVWPQLFGLQTTAGVAQAVSLRGLAIAVAACCIVGLGLLALVSTTVRRLAASLALVFFVFVLLSGAVVATRGLGNPALETKSDNDITVLSWNTLGDAPGAEAIAKLALDSEADIIVLPETTKALGDDVAGRMAAANRMMWSYTLAYDQVSKARSTTLLVSDDLGEYRFDAGARTTSVLPSIVATPVSGTGPTIIAVHPVAPIPGELDNWRSDLQWLRDACNGPNVIMAGDFNSTIDHFAGLGNGDGTVLGDCRDAAALTDNAAVGTWPTTLPALAGAPIDHIMQTANWRVSGMRVYESYDAYGSDHRPIIAQLSPAG